MTKTKYASLFIITAASIAFCAGCTKEDPAAAAETEVIDLAETPDLFEQPVQSNPLAPQPEDVVLTVEGEDITHGEIMQSVQTTMMQLSRQMPPQQLSQMYGQVYQNVTDSLIANVLLTKAAETSSLKVSDEELNEEIDQIKASAPEGQSLEDALSANGIDFAEWKEDLRKQMLIGKLVEEKTADIAEATDEAVAAFYQENIDSFKVPATYTASHILLMTQEATDEEKAEKKAQLEKIRADIIAGTITFADAAKQYSEDPGSKDNGGEYQDVPKGRMVPEFEAAALETPIGEISDLVETAYGYHIIMPTDQQPEGIRPLDEVTEQLKNYLTNQKKQEALVAYIAMLRENADIVKHELNMDAGSEPAAAE